MFWSRWRYQRSKTVVALVRIGAEGSFSEDAGARNTTLLKGRVFGLSRFMTLENSSASVTSIKPLGANSGRYAVSIAGERRVVSAEIIASHGLKPGRVISESELAVLDDAVRALAVFDRAVRLLAVRAYGSGELRRRLTRDRDVSKTDASSAIDKLLSLGLLDDERYALQRAHLLAQRSAMSFRRIAQELARRGLDRSVVERAVAQLKADTSEARSYHDVAGSDADEKGDGESDAAFAAAAKRMRSLRSLDASTQKRRLTAFLARRGFGYSDISAALRRLGQEMDQEE